MLICAMSSFSLLAQDGIVKDKGVKIAVDKIVTILDKDGMSLLPQQLTLLKEALQVERSSISSIMRTYKGADMQIVKPKLDAIKQNTDDKLKQILKTNQFAAIEQIRAIKPAPKQGESKMKVNPNVGTKDALRKAPADIETTQQAPTTKKTPTNTGKVSQPKVKEAPVKKVPKKDKLEIKPPTSKSPDAKKQKTPKTQKGKSGKAQKRPGKTQSGKGKPGKVKAPKQRLKSLDMMKSKLADGGQPLSTQQEAKLERVLKAERNAIQAAKKHAGDDKKAFASKAKEIRKSNASQIKSILTSKQYKLVKALRKAQPE